MSFIDTHCHLNFKAFEGGQKKIIDRAFQAGVTKFVVPGTDLSTSISAHGLTKIFPSVYAVVGVHPHHIHNYSPNNLEKEIDADMIQIEKMIQDDKILGIGEIGFDRHEYHASRYGSGIQISDQMIDDQKLLLQKQVQIASKYKKTLVIHNREAQADLISFIRENAQMLGDMGGRVVFHCCEAEDTLLEIAVDFGFFIGVDGDLTYDTKKQDFISKVPIEMIVLETDSPYILPEPLRSARKYPNNPANIPIIAEKLALLKGCGLDEIAHITTENAKRLFSTDFSG